MSASGWGWTRPSTTVNGDPRIAEPGARSTTKHGERVRLGNQFGAEAVRVTVREAAVLQSFRPDYPWRGNRTAQYVQVGNAVPPLLARAILAELIDPALAGGEAMIVDLFAGPGGWSEGLRMLGHQELGIEWDDAACATARAAGHERLQADVAALDPGGYPCDGLIASPPCQAWSMAGKGGGRRDVEHVIACALELAAGSDTRAEHAAKCEDERSMLVVEPLRWAIALEPAWIVCEQVPPVLELWTLFAQILEQRGYSTWAGVLEAERYGVPQTRERAILIARRDGRPAQPPPPTHQRYVPREPRRHDITLEGEILPWVSMAEALGWSQDIEVEHRRGGDRLEERWSADRPSDTVTTRANRWQLRPHPPTHMRTGNFTSPGNYADKADGRSEPYERSVDEPAPAIRGGRTPDWTGLPPTTAELQREDWHESRPATTVAGDARIFQPGGHHEQGQQSKNAVRVTVQEAAILQSFRPDYPWQGSRTKQFEQVGNAVPPLLARAVLAELVPVVTAAAA